MFYFKLAPLCSGTRALLEMHTLPVLGWPGTWHPALCCRTRGPSTIWDNSIEDERHSKAYAILTEDSLCMISRLKHGSLEVLHRLGLLTSREA